MSKPEELQARIDQLRKEIDNSCTSHYNAGPEISKRQSEIFVLASQLTEISTRRIIRLTWFLALLTVALLSVAVMQTKIMFKQDTEAHQQTIQARLYDYTPNTNK